MAMRIERVKLVGVVEIPLDNRRTAIALLFDNMRWRLDFADDPATYRERKRQIGSTVTFLDEEATDLARRMRAADFEDQDA